VRLRKRTIGARRRIEGKTTTPSLSIKSEFARTTPRPFQNVAASHAPVTRSLQLPRILSTISIQQLTMLLRFQCSKSTDNPKIYVSSAARQQGRAKFRPPSQHTVRGRRGTAIRRASDFSRDETVDYSGACLRVLWRGHRIPSFHVSVPRLSEMDVNSLHAAFLKTGGQVGCKVSICSSW